MHPLSTLVATDKLLISTLVTVSISDLIPAIHNYRCRHAGLVLLVNPVSKSPSRPRVRVGLAGSTAFNSSTSKLAHTVFPLRCAPSGLATQTTKLLGNEAVQQCQSA